MDGVEDDRAAQGRLAVGWRHLAAFFQEGARHLPEAVAAFREAERLQRRAGGGDALVNTLLGLSLALRLLRDPEEGRRAIVLAQELVNIVRRARGDQDALAYRGALEAAYRDLADVERDDAAIGAAEQGIEACDRTLHLARRLGVDAPVPAARATKAALLVRLAALRGQVDARRRRDAERLFAAALAAWPERDIEGGAVVKCDFAEALAAGGDAGRAELFAGEAADALRGAGNRYLQARAARAEARAALAAGRADALDRVVAAAAAFRALACEWDAGQVEAFV
ncbi:MAG TPA: hypothetical protein VEZ44_12410 [bacterium]|nr:hypothetical protein [bacterium]